MTLEPRDRLFCFTHVPKSGGTTLDVILRRHFGLRHMDVLPRRGWLYTYQDLVADLRLNPFAQSLSGHWIRPFIDYREYAERLLWYTVLRDPVMRYLSHFQHHIEKLGASRSFEDWLGDSIQHNWQTQHLAGEQDVEAAKQILATRFRFVGLLERFVESLLLLQHQLGLEDLPIAYGRPRNPARSSDTRERLRDDRRRSRGLRAVPPEAVSRHRTADPQTGGRGE